MYHQKKGYLLSKSCNESDLLNNSNIENRYICASNDHSPRHRFTFNCEYSDINDHDEQHQEVNINIDWGGTEKTPLKNFPQAVIQNVATRLLFGVANIGGKVSPASIVKGYTEYRKDTFIYRSHPYYPQSGPWFDWAYFQ